MYRLILIILLLTASFELNSAGRSGEMKVKLGVAGMSGVNWKYEWCRWTAFSEGDPVNVKQRMLKRFLKPGHHDIQLKQSKSIFVPFQEFLSESFYLSALFL